MALIPNTTTRELTPAKSEYQGLALAQMRELLNQLRLGKLKTGVRLLRLDNGVIIRCEVNYLAQNITIYLPPSIVVSEDVPVVLGIYGFFTKPRSSNYNYIHSDDTLGAIIVRIRDVWEISPEYPLEDGYRSGIVCGNVYWVGKELADKSIPVFCFKGPAGRLIPYSPRTEFFDEYTFIDEETLTAFYYTVFQSYIYSKGKIRYTLPDITSTHTKVMGVGCDDTGTVLCVVNVNYRDVANPDGGIGGFYDYVLVRQQVDQPIHPFEIAGWTILLTERGIAPTEIWRFNASGTKAINSGYEIEIIKITNETVVSYTASLSQLQRDAVGERIYTQDSVQGNTWEITETSSVTLYKDFNIDNTEGISVQWSQNHSTEKTVMSLPLEKNLPMLRSGELNDGIITGCEITEYGSGTGINEISINVGGEIVNYSATASLIGAVGCDSDIVYTWSYTQPNPNHPSTCIVGTVISAGALTVVASHGTASCTKTIEIPPVYSGAYHWEHSFVETCTPAGFGCNRDEANDTPLSWDGPTPMDITSYLCTSVTCASNLCLAGCTGGCESSTPCTGWFGAGNVARIGTVVWTKVCGTGGDGKVPCNNAV